MIELLPRCQVEPNLRQSATEMPTIDQTATPNRGLSEREVLDRRASGQGNTAPLPSSRTYRQIVVENICTFINICLFGLGIALALLGRPGDALISCGIITLNVLVSVAQEIRAKRTLDQIALLTRPTATVVRDGQPRVVRPEELAVGDLIAVGAGDQIVVDGVVLGAGRMQVDESQLSGESHPVPKRAGDQVFSGSFVVSGGGTYTAVAVGAQSLAGQITAGARMFRRVLTPLQSEINVVIRIMLLIVIYLEFLLSLNGLLKSITLAESVQHAAIIASLVPNGLFVSISVAYALAAVRIIRFGALVQQSNAVESLSRVDVLCLDKTGTLTTNRLQLDALHPLDPALMAGDLEQLLGAMVASASTGNTTSAALAAALPAEPRALVAEVPFSSARKWSALAFADGIYALGAPEFLRPYVCVDAWPAIAAMAQELSDRGLRVLLLVHHPDASQLADGGDDSRLPTGMRPLGLVSLSDELRPEARATLAAFIRSGVQPKIISGDSPETVAALAHQAGLPADARLVSGMELAEMDEAAFASAAADSTIFGRITPQQKERLVRALKARGHYVAMIGDGVNDVLSLKQANLGIAMQTGSQAARGVADMVLLNDSFTALAPAVQEGQRIINGMHDILKLFLTRIATVGLVLVSSLLIGEFPLELRAGSLLSLLSVGVPTMVLAVWARPGPAPKERLFHFVLTPALVTSAIGLLLFYGVIEALIVQHIGTITPHIAQEQLMQIYAAVVPVARTALTTFLVCCGLLLVVFVEPPTAWWTGGDVLSGDWRPSILAGVLLAVFVAIAAVPGLRAGFGLVELPPIAVGLVTAALAAWLLLVRWLWRTRAIERFIGRADQQESGHSDDAVWHQEARGAA